ncbi:hypothetical protein BJ875DRAFT_459268 [Amylocarpus encephaloides]|uniref:Glucose-methanol-choline oxidoreductase N-terminal domain-containing protein n=1 Tax=Amylocarpus encephaloides TaxID=45428 RepID=A0A9P7YKK6_9HELO|nr:hypothetical protein BJ875DRAFT_459268 [Amylocarpus encephaloides]
MMAKHSTAIAAFFSLLVISLFNLFTEASPRFITPSKLIEQREVEAEYDYVIVGGGTAGLTVADRLTESGNFTVLVIEYGDFDNSSSIFSVVGGGQGLSNRTRLFSFPSVRQPGLNNITEQIVIGKILGGSSACNAMLFLRGQIEDYDGWASFWGGTSTWDWKGILPYFKKASTLTPPPDSLAQEFNIKYDKSFWGDTGTRIFATFPTFQWPQLKTNMNAFRDIAGITYPPDAGSGLPGVFWFPSSVNPVTITRSFARTGHWDGIARSNYHTITGSKVFKVLFEGDTASGVQYVPSTARSAITQNTKTVKARREIILSTGTIHSPQILQASGIGPKDLLGSADITVKVDLPGVGQNLQDHLYTFSQTHTFEKFDVHPNLDDMTSNATFAAAAQQLFEQDRSGPLGIGAGNAAAYLPFPVVAPDAFSKIAAAYEQADPAAHLPSNTHATIIAGYKAQQAAHAAILRSNGSASYNSVFKGGRTEGSTLHLHPVSRGSVNIDPKAPIFAEPIVDYRALSNPIDLDIMIELFKFTRRYFAVPSLAAFSPRETNPGPSVDTDAKIGNWLRGVVRPSAFHPVGTCAMLPKELGGVVDAELFVHGVKGLRVVDASVMPMLPGAYTQQSTYAIAEKAADLIKARQ